MCSDDAIFFHTGPKLAYRRWHHSSAGNREMSGNVAAECCCHYMLSPCWNPHPGGVSGILPGGHTGKRVE